MIVQEAHVGTTRDVTWSIDQIVQIQARITLEVVVIRAFFWMFFFLMVVFHDQYDQYDQYDTTNTTNTTNTINTINTHAVFNV
jgi:hypothetical protein